MLPNIDNHNGKINGLEVKTECKICRSTMKPHHQPKSCWSDCFEREVEEKSQELHFVPSDINPRRFHPLAYIIKQGWHENTAAGKISLATMKKYDRRIGWSVDSRLHGHVEFQWWLLLNSTCLHLSSFEFDFRNGSTLFVHVHRLEGRRRSKCGGVHQQPETNSQISIFFSLLLPIFILYSTPTIVFSKVILHHVILFKKQSRTTPPFLHWELNYHSVIGMMIIKSSAGD